MAPERALQFCQHNGCCELTPGRFCQAHAAEHAAMEAQAQTRYNRERGSAASQGYDQDWTNLRNVYIRRHPLCETCLLAGRVSASEMVHHIVAIKDDPSRRLDPHNLRALCNTCHEKIEGPNRFKRRE